MNHATSYRISWTRDPRRESAALLVALRGRMLVIFMVLAVIVAALTALLQMWIITLLVVIVAVGTPFSARNRLRKSYQNGEQTVRVALSDRGVRLGSSDVAPWSTFTHWDQTPHDILLLQKPGRRVRAGLLIPVDAVKEQDLEGVQALIDRHLERKS